jgi:hypothetical protein
MASRLAIDVAEANALADSLRHSESSGSTEEPLDSLELLLAVSLTAQVRGASADARFKKLKFLLRNNSPRAVKLANAWADQQLSFDDLLAGV